MAIKKRPIKTYQTITADPDWMYANFGAKKHGAARGHYPGSAVEIIGAVPVQKWSRPSTVLFLWATNPKMDQAIDVMRAWNFELVTSFPWIKTVPSQAELAKGIGFWVYGASEHLLVCRNKRGKAPKYKSAVEKPDGLLMGDKDVAAFYSRRGAHSAKPLSLIEWITSYFPGPFLELYARGERPGWTCWGHETGHHLDHNGVSAYDGK